ncbi:N-glycosylase/DNA lyase [Culicoides brevitarsis]|uniref:N-glycosylase/DNA lyase n=1 Tax=Culicoides brevitarsis TaxID=469753 RepID=UPI00307BABD4
MSWKKIVVPKNELNLRLTLLGGQSFRWKEVENETFIGVFANILWKLKQNDDSLLYKIEGETNCDEIYLKMKLNTTKPPKKAKSKQFYEDVHYENLLRCYLRLDVNLQDLCQKWKKAHPHFTEITNLTNHEFLGVRQLNQAVTENIISFICSQNNNIKRISSLVSKFCELYGTKIANCEGDDWYSFPNIADLKDSKMEEKLRASSFGYRARYIAKCTEEIKEKGEIEWYSKLQNLSYKEAHAELLTLTGIGPKVADCICLMSLGHLDSIPVDTHVFQIAKAHYLPSLKPTKSISSKVYEEIKDTFREIYGPYAGWAQTIMFCADLKQFQMPKKNLNTEEAEKIQQKIKIEVKITEK